MQLVPLIQEVSKDIINKTAMLKRVKGKVKSISDDNHSAQIIINSPGSELKQKVLILSVSQNYTISVDDIVWVYYWKNIADGYILPNQMYGVGKFLNPSKNSVTLTTDNNGIVNSNVSRERYNTFIGNDNHITFPSSTTYPGVVANVLIEGRGNTVNLPGNASNIQNSIISGFDNALRFTVADSNSMVFVSGFNNRIQGDSASNSHIIGINNEITNNCYNVFAFAHEGYYANTNTRNYAQFLIGNQPYINASARTIAKDIAIAFGCDTVFSTTHVNGMELMNSGDLNVKGTVNSGGADYAEYEEWLDGNSDNTDRRGRFVVEEGDYIRLATSKDNPDEILGVVSSNPTICGDSRSQAWKGLYKTDVFGKTVFEEVNYIDESGKDKVSVAPIVNEEYDPDLQYVSRAERKEYDPIAYVGKVVMVDDGTCEANGYCKSADNGIATRADNRTRFRVRKRIDDTHILVRII